MWSFINQNLLNVTSVTSCLPVIRLLLLWELPENHQTAEGATLRAVRSECRPNSSKWGTHNFTNLTINKLYEIKAERNACCCNYRFHPLCFFPHTAETISTSVNQRRLKSSTWRSNVRRSDKINTDLFKKLFGSNGYRMVEGGWHRVARCISSSAGQLRATFQDSRTLKRTSY